MLLKEHSRVTDIMVSHNYSLKKAVKTVNDSESPLKYVRNDLDYRLIKVYVDLQRNEREVLGVLSKYVHAHPMWDLFFKNVYGCGEQIAAMCISYLDIDKARHVSSFWKYCGIDTVADTDFNGNQVFLTKDGNYNKCIQKFSYLTSIGEAYVGPVNEKEGELYSTEGELIEKIPEVRNVNGEDYFVYTLCDSGEEYVGNVMASRHGRRMGDTEMYEYTTKTGETSLKRGITFNPNLKSKLLGVFAPCVIKVGQRFGYNKYEDVYRDYRSRLDNNPKYARKSDMNKHRMAIRRLVREFLRDLWVCWRSYEGYELTMPYEVEFLGRAPHRFNQAHVDAVGTQREGKKPVEVW